MIPYILHVTVITTVCFLFYKLLLQKETFYRLNRWTLMGCLAVSFTLPLVPVPRDWSWRESWTAKPVSRVTPPVMTTPSPVAKAEPVQSMPDGTVQDEDVRSAPVVKPVHAVKHAESKKATPSLAETVVVGPVSGPKPEPQPTVAAVNKVEPAAQPKESVSPDTTIDTMMVVLQWLFYLYAFGVILFGGNFLLQIVILLYQSYGRPVIRDGRFRIVEINGNRAPCSFGNTIFINPASYDWETYNQILIHEKVHISGRHTLDILLAEMALVVQWFNPFVWLYRREVENNLEFLTDASVLEHREVERSAYQLSLLRVSAPHLPFSITNNYNQSLLKRRIVMMNSKQSSLHTVWKYFFLIPLLTGLVCALNKPAAYAAGKRALAGITDRRIKPMNTGLSGWANSGLPDTSRKPRTDSTWSRHDSLTGPARPNLSMDAGDDGGDARVQAKMDELRATEQTRLDEPGMANPRPAAVQMARDEADAQVWKSDIDARTAGAYDAAMAKQAGRLSGDEQAAAIARAKVDMDMRMNMDLKVKVQPNVDVRANVDVNPGDFRMASDSEMMEGAWFGTSYSNESEYIQFELKRESENGSWNYNFSVKKSEFNPFPGQGNVEFKLVRDAGTLVFKGQFDGQEGFGHFRFTADEAYFNSMTQMGFEVDGRRMPFFTSNIKKDYAAMLLHNFPHLSAHELFACAGNHIDQEYIQYWKGAGLGDEDNPRTLIQLKSMHIDRAYVDELKAAGYDHLGTRDLVSLKSQRVDGAFIREMKGAGYDHPEVRELVELKSQHIDGAYVKTMGRGKDNEMIPVRELVGYKAAHIDSGYLASLRKVGYGDLDRNQLMSMYSQHVTADFIKSFQEIGYKDLSARDLVNLRVMGVTPEFVKGFMDIGYTTPNINQLRQMKDQHISPADIKVWRDLGYSEINPNQVIGLNNLRITPDFVREFNKLGFDHIPLNLLMNLKSTGVNAEYITKMKEKGFESKDLSKYIRLKNDFN